MWGIIFSPVYRAHSTTYTDLKRGSERGGVRGEWEEGKEVLNLGSYSGRAFVQDEKANGGLFTFYTYTHTHTHTHTLHTFTHIHTHTQTHDTHASAQYYTSCPLNYVIAEKKLPAPSHKYLSQYPRIG